MTLLNSTSVETGSGAGIGSAPDRQLGGTPLAPSAPAGRAHYALFLLTVVGALNYFDRSIFSVVLESIKSEMRLSDTSIGLLGGFVFVLFYSILGLPVAYLADRYSRRNVIAIGLAFWSIMTALTGMAANVWQLALTRFLMGAGEASNVAPANSLVSDLYSKERRSFVLAVAAMGSTIGMSLAFLVGGLMNQHYGWRSAFYVGSIPGIPVAILLLLTVREPVRGAYEKAKAPAQASAFRETMGFLFRSKAYVLVVIGGCMMSIALYAMIIWSAAFLIRVHHLSSEGAGAFVGISQLASLPGYLLGGFLAARLGERDERWRVWIPGLGCALYGLATILFLLPDSRSASFAGLGLASFFAALHFGPVYALCLNVAKLRMRAVSTAIFLLCVNLVGQVIGPLETGYLNDAMTSIFGNTAIRYSMLMGALCAVVAGAFIWISSRYIVQDTRRALEV